MKTTESVGKLISVVVPSVNENSAKTIFLETEAYNSMFKSVRPDKEIFALFCDCDVKGNTYDTGHGTLTKKDFDIHLKEKYNKMKSLNKKGIPLNDVE